MLGFGHSLKKANISLAVAVAVLVGGTLLVGFDAPDIERQAVSVAGFVAGFTCLFSLYGRERRLRERASATTSTASPTPTAKRPVVAPAPRRRGP